ncbi:MAG: MlaA family lipoprotein, partial [Syntrophobacteria bacterium]
MKITFYHLIVLALGLAGCSGLSDTRTSAACPSHQTSGSAAPSAGSFQVAAATDIQGVSPSAGSEFGEAEPLEFLEEEVPPDTIADPLEPINRVFFHFNDKLYFWALKPAASGYRKVLPEGVRISVRNFFSNLATPI